jgi:flagellar biosynthesis/type III secretory pathway protein FliH
LRVTLSSPTTFIGSVSAAIAFAAFLAYVYGLRRSNQAAARDEALALADTRGQMIAELRRRVAALERGQKQARTHYRRNLRELEDALEQARREAREQAYRTQRLYVLAFEEVLADIREELGKTPANVDGALARIAELLADEALRSNAN